MKKITITALLFFGIAQATWAQKLTSPPARDSLKVNVLLKNFLNNCLKQTSQCPPEWNKTWAYLCPYGAAPAVQLINIKSGRVDYQAPSLVNLASGLIIKASNFPLVHNVTAVRASWGKSKIDTVYAYYTPN